MVTLCLPSNRTLLAQFPRELWRLELRTGTCVLVDEAGQFIASQPYTLRVKCCVGLEKDREGHVDGRDVTTVALIQPGESSVSLDLRGLPTSGRFRISLSASVEADDSSETEVLPTTSEYMDARKDVLYRLGSQALLRNYRAFKLGPSNLEITICEERGIAVGSHVWNSGIVLAEYIARWVDSGSASLAGARVLELGSGCGLAGITAAKLGAAVVCMTDRSGALSHLQTNINLNGVSDVASTMALDWSSLSDPAAALSGNGYDLVLAADVLYAKDSLASLAETMLAACKSGAEVLLAQRRRDGSTLVDIFKEVVVTKGLSMTLVESVQGVQVEIYVLRLASSEPDDPLVDTIHQQLET